MWVLYGVLGASALIWALATFFRWQEAKHDEKAQKPIQRVIHEHQPATFGSVEAINVMVEEQTRVIARRRAEEEYGSKDP